MGIEIQTNATPIFAGDEIGIVIHTDGLDVFNMWYSLDLVAPTRRLVSALSPFNPHYDWTVDAVGNHILVKATGHGAFGLISNSVFSDPFTVLPDAPKVTAPRDDDLLSAGSTYSVRWTQNPPHADSYRILFSSNGGTDFHQLGPDVSGSATSATVQVPTAPTDDGRLRVEGIFDGFNPAFREDVTVRTTSAPVVHLTRPGPGAIWHMGDDETIAWEAGGQIDHFKIQLSRDGGHTWATIFPSLGGSERQVAYAVDPPASQSCRLRIEAFGPTGSGLDVSDASFRIRPGR